MSNAPLSHESGSDVNPQSAKVELEVDYVRRQIEKLSFEIDELKRARSLEGRVKSLAPLYGTVIGLLGLWAGFYQFLQTTRLAYQQLDHARLTQEAQQKFATEVSLRESLRETAKPLWEKRLSLYIEATEKAALIATATDDGSRLDAEARFWVLYWGPLAAVEDIRPGNEQEAVIEKKMVEFGRLLAAKPADRDKGKLQQASLELAHAVRGSIIPAFDVQGANAANKGSLSQEP